jgi:diacylglycerol kinase family enzyme
MDAIRAIKLINEAEPQLMDYGLINLHPFFCTCGVGLDAFISQKFAEAGKRGFLTYVENILQNALSYNPETYEIELVDEESEKQVYEALLITCANASQWGNNAFIAPQASVRDGLMDVTIIEPFTLLEVPQLALQLMNGTIDKSGRIKSFRCKNLLIKRSKPGAIHYDGDPIVTGTDVDVHIEHLGIRILTNPEATEDTTPPNPILNAFSDFFNNINNVREDIGSGIEKGGRRIQAINKVLLKKLRS